ncbi:unnamed protein product, partial [Cyprideis torosa]
RGLGVGELLPEIQSTLEEGDGKYLIIDVGASRTSKNFHRDLDGDIQRGRETAAPEGSSPLLLYRALQPAMYSKEKTLDVEILLLKYKKQQTERTGIRMWRSKMRVEAQNESEFTENGAMGTDTDTAHYCAPLEGSGHLGQDKRCSL